MERQTLSAIKKITNSTPTKIQHIRMLTIIVPSLITGYWLIPGFLSILAKMMLFLVPFHILIYYILPVAFLTAEACYLNKSFMPQSIRRHISTSNKKILEITTNHGALKYTFIEVMSFISTGLSLIFDLIIPAFITHTLAYSLCSTVLIHILLSSGLAYSSFIIATYLCQITIKKIATGLPWLTVLKAEFGYVDTEEANHVLQESLHSFITQ